MQVGSARLSHVVRKLPGTVERIKRVMKKDKLGKWQMHEEKVKEPAGFMVYFPRGHAIRIKDEAGLKRYGLDNEPAMIGMDGLTDPRTPMGQLFLSQNEDRRAQSYQRMEENVVRLATIKSGPVLMPEQLAHLQVQTVSE